MCSHLHQLFLDGYSDKKAGQHSRLTKRVFLLNGYYVTRRDVEQKHPVTTF